MSQARERYEKKRKPEPERVDDERENQMENRDLKECVGLEHRARETKGNKEKKIVTVHQ